MMSFAFNMMVFVQTLMKFVFKIMKIVLKMMKLLLKIRKVAPLLRIKGLRKIDRDQTEKQSEFNKRSTENRLHLQELASLLHFQYKIHHFD